MSVYFNKNKGWRYDFILNGTRHTKAWFKTKKEAMIAKAKRREEVKHPITVTVNQTPTDMDFLELVNRKLDHVKVYQSEKHYKESIYYAKRWVKRWSNLTCSEITQDMIEKFIIERSSSGKYAANTELRLLRATFNLGIKKKQISHNPTNGISFLPVEKGIRKYIPTPEDIDKVIAVADPDTQAYLWAIRETMARISEINRLTWDDVDIKNKCVTLKTRKKKGGNLTPRAVPMTQNLFEILSKRYINRSKSVPWVFYRMVWSKPEKKFVENPYKNRSKLMQILCKKAGVKHFGYHAIRHSGASIMDNANVPIGSIQRILGHENRSTTEIYLHKIGNADRDAILVFEKARQNSHTESHTVDKTLLSEETYH